MAILRSGLPSSSPLPVYHYLLRSYCWRLAHFPRLAISTSLFWLLSRPVLLLPVIVSATSSDDFWEAKFCNGWNNPGLANALSRRVSLHARESISNGAAAGLFFSAASSSQR